MTNWNLIWGAPLLCCVYTILRCFCIDPLNNKAQKAREAGRAARLEALREPPVRPLPANRSRALSVLPCDPQRQSLLFSRLPVELRITIWTLVLGSQNSKDVLHLELADGIVKYNRCLEARRYTRIGFYHECWTATCWSEAERAEYRAVVEQHTGTAAKLPQLTALLFTCKQM